MQTKTYADVLGNIPKLRALREDAARLQLAASIARGLGPSPSREDCAKALDKLAQAVGYFLRNREYLECIVEASLRLRAPERPQVIEPEPIPYSCPSCLSKGFEPSLMVGRCTFCDGTENSDPPSLADIRAWNDKEKPA